MEMKGSFQLDQLSGCEDTGWLKIYLEISHLKQLYRQGWLRRGVPRESCESVADHVFATALLAYWLARAHFPQLNADKVLRLALMHDLGEIYAGDIIPQDQIDPATKSTQERVAVEKIFSSLPSGAEYLALWDEFEQASSSEALFVRQVDRLEMAMQAYLYEQQGQGDLQEFFNSADQALDDPHLRRVFSAMVNCRGRSI